MVDKAAKKKTAKQAGSVAPTGGRGIVLAVAAGLVVVTVAAYWTSAGNGFVYYDDNNYVYENYHVRQGLTWEGVKWAFTAFESSNWHPLTWLSHMLDVQLFDLRPAGHHLVSLGWHVVNVLMLLGLLRYMTGRLWASVFVAALFALHPVHVESVAWVAERKDVLSTFLWLATTWVYVRYTRQPGVWRYLLVLGLFALGLMAKPMLVTLPVILLVLDYWPLERMSRMSMSQFIAEKVPLAVMAVVSSVVTVTAQESAIIQLAHASVAVRVTNALVSYCVYLRQMIWPAGLAAFYPHPQVALWGPAVGAMVVLAAITITCLGPGRGRKYLAMGWLWYIITLVPVVGLVQVGDQAHADRYTYIPLIGIFIAIAWGLGDILDGRSAMKVAAAAVAGIVLAGCGVLTCVQVGYWKNDVSLFGRAVQVVPGNYVMRMKLADAYLVERKYDEALAQADESLRIKPMGHTYAVIGAIWQSKGNLQKAYECYEQALAMNPDITSARVNLSAVLLDTGRYAEAEEQVRKVLAAEPYSADAWSILGRAQAGMGKLDEAKESLLKAIAIDPRGAMEHFALGGVYARKGDYAAALAEYQKSNTPQKNSTALGNAAGCLATLGRNEEAVTAYQESLAIDPNNAEMRYNYAILLSNMGKKGEAVEELKRVLAMAPNQAEAKELYRKLTSDVAP